MRRTDADFRRILAVERECFGESWAEQTLLSEINSPLSVLCVREYGGETAGFALGRLAADEGELLQIGVSADYRRRGIARELLGELCGELKGRGAVCCFLEVRSRNFAAISLYEGFGFKKIAVRKGYYGDDDALVYRLDM